MSVGIRGYQWDLLVSCALHLRPVTHPEGISPLVSIFIIVNRVHTTFRMFPKAECCSVASHCSLGRNFNRFPVGTVLVADSQVGGRGTLPCGVPQIGCGYTTRVSVKRKTHWRTDQIHWWGDRPDAEGDPPKAPQGKNIWVFLWILGVFWGYGRSVTFVRYTLRSGPKYPLA